MTASVVLPAQFGDPRFGRWGASGFAFGCVHGKLEIQLFAAAVAVDLPVDDCQLLEDRPVRHGHPLAWWIDQVTNLVHGQALVEVTAALEG